MASRQVKDLVWASRGSNPWSRPARPKGLKAEGVRYELAVARQLPAAEHGTWWEFKDWKGVGYCQTDLLLVGRDFVLVLECKRTWTPAGHQQLEGLYLPVVGRALGKPVLGVQVAKNLGPCSVTVVTDLKSAVALAKTGSRVCLHWIGQAPLLALSPGTTRNQLANVASGASA